MWSTFEIKGATPLNGGSGATSFQEGLIQTITGSLDSLSQLQDGVQEALYDTDHTDLNSDIDEAELRRELLKDKWRQLFDMFDPEGFGEIQISDFLAALRSPELQAQVPSNKRDVLKDRALRSTTGFITFQDFVNVVSALNFS